MSSSSPRPNDWAVDQEDWQFLESLPAADDQLRVLFGSYQELLFNPQEVLRTENQGRMGSCRGHGGTTGMEWIRTLITKAVGQQLSRMMLYVETQRRDGIRGDRGATIANGIRQMIEIGVCREELWPYPKAYSQQRPSDWQEVLKDAAKNKIGRADRLRSYEAIRTFLGAGQGFVDVGTAYRPEYYAEVAERFSGGNGGHAVVLIYLSQKIDSRGRPYIWGVNSHGLNTGRKGWFQWSPDFIDGAMRHSHTVMIGCSDMPNLEVRSTKFDFVKQSILG
ncbi:MAG: hypothetical protein KF752_11720 [Pirellulaceae bacterium]|nr:hypothetical protein [Pirellulaceae bacterium]